MAKKPAVVKRSTPPQKWFKNEGVIVKYPNQKKALKIDRITPVKADASIMKSFAGFTPTRPVMHLKVVYEDDPNNPAPVFTPPILLHVRYTPDDEENGGGSLKLGYWDDNMKTWIDLHAQLVPAKTDKYNGWGVAIISQWVDPIIAWGT